VALWGTLVRHKVNAPSKGSKVYQSVSNTTAPCISLETACATGMSKMTSISDASCAGHPSRCHPADEAKAHLVKLIEHATEESDRPLQIGTTRQAQVRRCTPVIVFRVSDRRHSTPTCSSPIQLIVTRIGSGFVVVTTPSATWFRRDFGWRTH